MGDGAGPVSSDTTARRSGPSPRALPREVGAAEGGDAVADAVEDDVEDDVTSARVVVGWRVVSPVGVARPVLASVAGAVECGRRVQRKAGGRMPSRGAARTPRAAAVGVPGAGGVVRPGAVEGDAARGAVVGRVGANRRTVPELPVAPLPSRAWAADHRCADPGAGAVRSAVRSAEVGRDPGVGRADRAGAGAPEACAGLTVCAGRKAVAMLSIARAPGRSEASSGRAVPMADDRVGDPLAVRDTPATRDAPAPPGRSGAGAGDPGTGPRRRSGRGPVEGAAAEPPGDRVTRDPPAGRSGDRAIAVSPASGRRSASPCRTVAGTEGVDGAGRRPAAAATGAGEAAVGRDGDTGVRGSGDGTSARRRTVGEPVGAAGIPTGPRFGVDDGVGVDDGLGVDAGWTTVDGPSEGDRVGVVATVRSDGAAGAMGVERVRCLAPRIPARSGGDQGPDHVLTAGRSGRGACSDRRSVDVLTVGSRWCSVEFTGASRPAGWVPLPSTTPAAVRVGWATVTAGRERAIPPAAGTVASALPRAVRLVVAG